MVFIQFSVNFIYTILSNHITTPSIFVITYSISYFNKKCKLSVKIIILIVIQYLHKIHLNKYEK